MYGKLFVQMYDGTLATKGPWQAMVTFQQLVILADREGQVDMTADAISRRTTIPLKIIEQGIEALLEPDPKSRSPKDEGRRIKPLSDTRDWGWVLVNYEQYCKIRSAEERREYMRNYMGDKRSKQALAKLAHVDVDVDVDVDVLKSTTLAANVLQKAAKRSLPAPKIGFDFKTWKFTGLDDEQFLDWQDAFPAVIVPTEVDRAAAWLKANPANKKKNYARFLVAWMGRAQDRAPAQGGGAR